VYILLPISFYRFSVLPVIGVGARPVIKVLCLRHYRERGEDDGAEYKKRRN